MAQFVSLLIAAGVFEIISFSWCARCSSAHFFCSKERAERATASRYTPVGTLKMMKKERASELERERAQRILFALVINYNLAELLKRHTFFHGGSLERTFSRAETAFHFDFSKIGSVLKGADISSMDLRRFQVISNIF